MIVSLDRGGNREVAAVGAGVAGRLDIPRSCRPLGRRSVWLSDQVALVQQVPEDSPLGVECQEVGLPAGEFAHDRAGALLACEVNFDDPVIRYLSDIDDPDTLKMGSQKLAERPRCRRIRVAESGKVQSGSLRLAGDEDSIRLPGEADIEHDHALAGLLYLSNPPASQHRGDFSNHLCKVCFVQCHLDLPDLVLG